MVETVEEIRQEPTISCCTIKHVDGRIIPENWTLVTLGRLRGPRRRRHAQPSRWPIPYWHAPRAHPVARRPGQSGTQDLVNASNARTAPSDTVLSAFGLTGSLHPLCGGQETAWLVEGVVLKPLDMTPVELAWQHTLLCRLAGRNDFRVSVPLRTTDGPFIADSWTAWRYEVAANANAVGPTLSRSGANSTVSWL